MGQACPHYAEHGLDAESSSDYPPEWEVRINFGPLKVTEELTELGYFNDTGMPFDVDSLRVWDAGRGRVVFDTFDVGERVRIRKCNPTFMRSKQRDITQPMIDMAGSCGVVETLSTDLGWPVVHGHAWNPVLLEPDESNKSSKYRDQKRIHFQFGWSGSNSQYTRDRRIRNRHNRRRGRAPSSHLQADSVRSTLTHLRGGGSRTWKIRLPPGKYKVSVTVGDPSFASVANIAITGAKTTVLSRDKRLSCGEFAEITTKTSIQTNDDGMFEMRCTHESGEKEFSVKLVSATFSRMEGGYEILCAQCMDHSSPEEKTSSKASPGLSKFVLEVSERMFIDYEVDVLLGLEQGPSHRRMQKADAGRGESMAGSTAAGSKKSKPIYSKTISQSLLCKRSRQGLDINSDKQQGPLDIYLDEVAAGVSRVDGGVGTRSDFESGAHGGVSSNKITLPQPFKKS
eukprot:g1464.t1